MPDGEIIIVPAYTQMGEQSLTVRGGIRFPVVEGIAKIEIPIDSVNFNITTRTNTSMIDGIRERPKGVPGYCLPFTNIKRLPSGEYPAEISVACRPAGAVTLRLLDLSAHPYTDRVTLESHTLSVENDDGWPSHFDVQGSNTDLGTVVFHPLPLGGVFVFSARVGKSYLISPVVRLREANPIAEVVLQMGEGQTLYGLVVDSEGTPLEGIPYQLNYRVSDEFMGSQNGVTDVDGIIEIQEIQYNPDVEYSLKIRPGDMPYAPRNIAGPSFRKQVKIVLEDK